MNLEQLLHHKIDPIGLGVIGMLLLMSMVSVGIIVERWWIYRRAARQSKGCALEAARLLRAGRLREAQELAARPSVRDSHLARVISTGLREWEQDWQEGEQAVRTETVRTAVRHAAAESVGDLRRGLVVLGTIASTAPFVGLFGTTFGIIHAFSAIAQNNSTDFGAISAGISEALITTAFGLFVAIPALWAYNGLGGRVERFASELDRAGDQLLLFLTRRSQ
jgi:biopolymer transport protein ExbB/biopolymer transport protein TolQ